MLAINVTLIMSSVFKVHDLHQGLHFSAFHYFLGKLFISEVLKQLEGKRVIFEGCIFCKFREMKISAKTAPVKSLR